jgi:hypothetical protein
MLFKSTRDWKTLLTPEDERRLNEVIERAAKHRGAYFNAEEVKVAQIWCALLEARKENAQLEARIKRLEYLLGGVLSRNKRLADARGDLLESLGKF